MKKNIHLLSFLLFISTFLFAQKEEKFRFGFYGGGTYSHLKNTDDYTVAEYQKGLLCLHGGVIGQCEINPQWAVNLMTGMNMKGSKWETGVDLFSSERAWRLYYFSLIPQVRYKYHFIFFEFGPEFSHLVLHSAKEFGGEWSKETFPFVKKRDVAMQIGMGIKINRQSYIVLRFSRSMLNISDSFPGSIGNFGNFESNDYFKNQLLQISFQNFAF